MKSIARIIGGAAVFACLGWGVAGARAEGVFSATAPLGNTNLDASIGLSTNKTYLHAFDLFSGANPTINGVVFTNVAAAANPSVAGVFGTTGWNTSTTGGDTIGAGSGLNTLLNNFNYNTAGGPGQVETLSLSNLIAGQTYALTFYSKAWGAAGGRVQNLSSSDGAFLPGYDENMGGANNANLLRYTFTATGTTAAVTFTSTVNGSMHFYGFSTEQTFNNLWTGGTNWSAATWSKLTPSGRGANASFADAAAATQLNVDSLTTIGHLQFAGTNPYTLAGGGALTLYADLGGVSVLSASNGTHTIAATVILTNDAVKLGAGNLVLTGLMQGTNTLGVNMGALVVSNRYALASPVVQPGGGAVQFGAGITNASFGGLTGRSNLVLQTQDGSPLPVTLGVGANNGSTTYGGVLSGAGALSKIGTGMLTLTNLNLQTGGTRVGGGTLALDYTAKSGALLPAAGVLTFAGGTLQLDRAASATATYTQNVASTTVDVGASQLTRGTGSSSVLNLGPVTRNAGGLLNVGATNIATVNNANLNDILGAWATVGGTDWAVNSTGGANGPIQAYSGYSDLLLGGTIASNGAANLRLVTNGVGAITMAAAGVTDLNTLKHTETAASVVDVGTGNTLRFGAAGGVLAPSGSGSLAITNGTLTAGGATDTAGDLTVNNQSANAVTVYSTLANNGAGAVSLTKGGSGSLILNAANTHGGGTFINAGTVQMNEIGALGGGAVTIGHGAALQVAASGTVTNRVTLFGNDQNLRLDNGFNATFTGDIVNGDGSAGTLTIDGVSAGTRSHNLVFSNSTMTLGAKTLLVQGPIANGDGQANAQKTTLTNVTLTTAGDVQVGRAALVFAGSTVADIGGKLTGQYNNTSDWANVTIQDSAVVTAAGGVDRNVNAAWGLNLNGGTLRTPYINTDDYTGSGTRRFYLNGGRLVALASTTNFIQIAGGGAGTPYGVYVKAGGAIIDSSNNTVTIAVPLKNDSGTDGGLTKYGSGTLTLTGTNTFNGNTRVNEGTLSLGNNLALQNSALDTAGAGTVALTGTTPTFGGLTGGADLASVITSGYGSVTALTLNPGTGFSNSYSGAIANGAAGMTLTKSGAGTQVFAGANTYSGLTTISAGQLMLNHTLAAQNSTVSNTIANGLAFGAATSAYSIGGLTGAGNIALTNTAGAVVLSAGSNNASTLYSGVLSGSGAFAKTGSGTLILTGTNTYGGGTLISGGTLQLNDQTAGGALGSGPVTNNATLAFRANNLVTVANTISGTGALIQSPAASSSTTILELTGANTYLGGTVVSNGCIRARHASAFGTGPVTVQSNGLVALWWNTGSSTMTNDFFLDSMGGNASGDASNKNAIHTDGAAGGFSTFTLSGTITLNGNSSIGTYQDNNLLISGKITGSGGLSKGIGRPQEGAALTLSNTANDYAGDTTVRAGTLKLGAAGVIPDGTGKGNVVIVTNANATGVLDLAGFRETINGLSGNGRVNNSTGAGVLTVGNNNATGVANSFTGIVQNTGGTLALVKTGTGTLALSGANTYSGGTTIENGTLQAGSTSALGSDGRPLTMNGGTLDLHGFGLTVASAGGTGGTVTDLGGAQASPTLLTVTQAANGTFTAVIADGPSQKVGLLKSGNGIMALANTNAHTYSGPTIIAGGTLQLSRRGAAQSGAVAYYGFDGSVTDTTANAHGGALEGTGTSFVAGRPYSGGSQSLNFTGSQAVAVGFKADLGLNNYTVSSWVNINSTPGQYGILGTRFGGDTTFDLKVQTTNVHGDVGSGSAWLSTAADFNYVMPTGTWHMITYAVDNAAQQVRMYLDGALSNTVSIAGTPLLMKAGQTLRIGNSSGVEFMNGRLDDLYIYGSAFSGSQVLQLYLSGAAGLATNQLPAATVVSIQSGAALDLGGVVQTLAGLSDYNGGGGLVTNGYAAPLTLTLNTPTGTNVTFGGAIADGGAGNAVALVKDGPGTQVLAGANTFSGGTTISNGVLRIGAGGTSGSIGAMANYGTVVFDRTDTNTHSGVISGSGAIVKEQANTLMLAADSSAFTGGTAVSNGTLSVNGQLGGLITVYSNATLGGVGTVRDVVVAESGILAPGNSAGILTASEAVTLQSNAVLSIELGEFGSDQLAMSGNLLTLEPGAVLDVSFLGGFEGSVTNLSTFAIVSGWNTGVFTIGGIEKNDGDQFTADGKTLQINYNPGTDITLTVIPEPATVGLLGVCVIAALLRRRFRA